MRTAIWIFFILTLMNGLARLVFLAIGNYPRVQTYESWHDAVSLVVNTLLAAWLALLLFG